MDALKKMLIHATPNHQAPSQNWLAPKIFASNHPCCQMNCAAFKYLPQSAATAFSLSSVFILLLWSKLNRICPGTLWPSFACLQCHLGWWWFSTGEKTTAVTYFGHPEQDQPTDHVLTIPYWLVMFQYRPMSADLSKMSGALASLFTSDTDPANNGNVLLITCEYMPNYLGQNMLVLILHIWMQRLLNTSSYRITSL